jgi:hypothetical protein
MSRVDALDRGRESFGRQEWGDAYAQLSAAGRQVSLEPDDLERLAVAAYLAGKDADSEEAWTGAHHQSLAVADWGRAARCAFWLGITLINRMEPARGGGWLARAQRVLDDAKHECVERGRNGVSGSPRVSGSTSASNAASRPGSVVVRRLGPPPRRRMRPPGSGGSSSSRTPA